MKLLKDLENTLLLGDCLDVMKDIPDGSIDMVLCDLPYEVTARNTWDVLIPLDALWDSYHRVAKETATFVFTAVQPFTTQLISSNPKMFKYDLIWEKNKVSGFLNAKKMPLRIHESILVFYRKFFLYNPQKTTGHKPVHKYTRGEIGPCYRPIISGFIGGGSTERFPTSVLHFPIVNNDSLEKIHPAQKPVALFEWLIRTYTNPGMLVLDNCIGSGTTAIACLNTGRKFIGIEKDPKFYADAKARVEKVMNGFGRT